MRNINRPKKPIIIIPRVLVINFWTFSEPASSSHTGELIPLLAAVGEVTEEPFSILFLTTKIFQNDRKKIIFALIGISIMKESINQKLGLVPIIMHIVYDIP